MILDNALKKLGNDFSNLNWAFLLERIAEKKEIVSFWPGDPSEDIMICVLKTNHMNEVFHRQDFFFINFAYKNDFEALSENSDNRIKIRENDSYIGQPFSGYAIQGDSDKEIIIVGILIQKETFFKEFLASLSFDNSLFHFFLDPQMDEFSDKMIHLSFRRNHPIRNLLNLMIVEYADKNSDTQAILKPMTLTVLMYIAREFKKSKQSTDNLSSVDEILKYISEHSENVTLEKLAQNFSYHPNYICSLLRKETGKTFSQIVLEQRMNRALSLLKGTNLSVEEISSIVGYNDPSNFYRSFRSYYHKSPREYLK